MVDRKQPADVQMAISGFELLRAGKHRQGLKLIEQASEVCPTAGNFVGLGVAYFILEDYDAACKLFDLLNEERPRFMQVYYEFSGVARWLTARPNEAAAVWHSGVRCGYTEGAGGVNIPLLLFFAAIRNKRAFELDKATAELERALKRSWAKNFPGNIGRFLLGKVDEAEMRKGCEYGGEKATVSCHLTADFYCGVLALHQGKQSAYKRAMCKFVERTTETNPKGKEWQPLFHLARYESS